MFKIRPALHSQQDASSENQKAEILAYPLKGSAPAKSGGRKLSWQLDILTMTLFALTMLVLGALFHSGTEEATVTAPKQKTVKAAPTLPSTTEDPFADVDPTRPPLPAAPVTIEEQRTILRIINGE